MSDSYTLLTPERCALMVIDPQERLMAAIHEADRVIDNITLLLHAARTLAIPVIASTQYEKGLGPFVDQLTGLLASAARADKTEFNALANREIKKLAAGLERTVDTLILAGVETHICVYQTALGARQAGLIPWVVADATSSRSARNHDLGLQRLRDLKIACGPAEMIVYELLNKAGTEEFKALQPQLK